MTSKLLWAGSALAIAAFAFASSADAQSRSRARPATGAPATPAATAVSGAPVPAQARVPQAPPQVTMTYAGATATPGICVVDTGRSVEQSKVGQATQARLNELAQPLEAALRKRGEEVDKLTGDEKNKQGAALELLAAQRSMQLARTRNTAIGKINAAVSTALPQVFKQHNCSVLLKADTIVSSTQVTGANAVTVTNFSAPGNDITTALTAQLDASLPVFSFDLEPMPTENEARQALQQMAQQRQQQ